MKAPDRFFVDAHTTPSLGDNEPLRQGLFLWSNTDAAACYMSHDTRCLGSVQSK